MHFKPHLLCFQDTKKKTFWFELKNNTNLRSKPKSGWIHLEAIRESGKFMFISLKTEAYWCTSARKHLVVVVISKHRLIAGQIGT